MPAATYLTYIRGGFDLTQLSEVTDEHLNFD